MAQPFTIVGPAAVSVALVGCAAGPRGAELTVEHWIQAAAQGDCAGMYDLLDATVTASLDTDEFIGWCELHREQLQSQAARLQDSADRNELEPRALMAVHGGRAVALTVDRESPSRWRLVEPLPFATGADSPLQLLSELRALVESGTMDRTLGMMSESMRAEYLAELQIVADALTAAEQAVVTVDGNWAEVSLGEVTVRLQQLQGAWQIDSVEQSTYYGYYDGY